jgi:lipoate-protein ligase A
MDKKLYFIDNTVLNPYFNLALEEYLLTNKKAGDFLMLWQNENTVVIGINQNAYEEINQDFIAIHNTAVVRRTTGGGAVYHDLGNINFSFITALNETDGFTINDFTKPVIAALNEMGVKAQANGRNDITVDGQKISGNAQRIYKNRILHHGTLLFKPNIENMSGALNVDKRKFQSKSTKSVESRVTSISDYIKDADIGDFKAMLIKNLSAYFSLEKYNLGTDELNIVNRLAKSKYTDQNWTFRAVQPMNFHSSRRFSGGTISISLKIEDENITDCCINGDFMAVSDITPVEKALTGTKFTPKEIRNKIEALPLRNILGEISEDEFIDCIFK